MLGFLLALLACSDDSPGERSDRRVDCDEVVAGATTPALERAYLEGFGSGNYAECRTKLFATDAMFVDAGRALCLAASEGDVEFVTFLLERGTPPDARPDATDFTPLMCAAMDNQASVVQLLLARGAVKTATWTQESKDGTRRVYTLREVAKMHGASNATLQLL